MSADPACTVIENEEISDARQPFLNPLDVMMEGQLLITL
jgi:hypothetical protein